MAVKLELYRVFKEVAETGNISVAAKNLVMKFLAAMTIIIAIPTVVSSFFGMNVPVPLADNPEGFFYVMLVAFAISITSAYILWRRDML